MSVMDIITSWLYSSLLKSSIVKILNFCNNLAAHIQWAQDLPMSQKKGAGTGLPVCSDHVKSSLW